MVNHIKTAAPIKTGGSICPACVTAKSRPFFYGASMLAFKTGHRGGNAANIKQIRNITNNLRFYNQVAVKLSIHHSAGSYGGAPALRGRAPDVKAFAAGLIEAALERELDREAAVMARGENVASNQRRQRVLGKYLLSKPYKVIKHFYGASMQKLTATASAEASDGGTFHSDIIHERTDKTVYSRTQTQIEHAAPPSVANVVISGVDLNRIAGQAAKQVERKMRTERERNGKW